MTHPAVLASAAALALALPASTALAASGLDAARNTGTRIGERLEQLRDPTGDTPRLAVDLRLERASAAPAADAWLAPEAPEPEAPGVDPGRFELRPLPVRELHLRSDAADPDPSGFWSRGAADLARESSGFLDLGGSLAALSTGFDGVSDHGTARGLAVGIDRNRYGDGGLVTQGSVAAYGTMSPVPGSYVDVIAGTVAEPGTPSGEPLLFGSATLGLERRSPGWLVAPYGRFEAARETRDARALGGRAVLGFRTETSLDARGARLHPQLRLEMERARMPGDAGKGRRVTTLAPALRADFSPDWNARIEHRSVFGETRESRLELRVTGRF